MRRNFMQQVWLPQSAVRKIGETEWLTFRVQSQQGQRLESCNILVTEANDLVRATHDRMPIILDPADGTVRLNSANKDIDGLLRMLAPASPNSATQGYGRA